MISKRYNKSLSRLADRNKKLRKIKIAAAFVLPVLLLIATSFVSRVSSLQISSVEVSGEQTIGKDDIVNATLESISGNKFFIFPKTNIFLVNESSLAAVLSREFPRVENINVEKNADGVIKIKIKEREAVASWCGEPGCYLVDINGLLYSPVNNEFESFGKIVLRGVLEGDPSMKYFQSREILASYLNAVSLLKQSNIETYSINVESRDKATIETSVGNIFIDPESVDLKESIENAILVVSNGVANSGQTKFEYIDVRFGNKVFYK